MYWGKSLRRLEKIEQLSFLWTEDKILGALKLEFGKVLFWVILFTIRDTSLYLYLYIDIDKDTDICISLQPAVLKRKLWKYYSVPLLRWHEKKSCFHLLKTTKNDLWLFCHYPCKGQRLTWYFQILLLMLGGVSLLSDL